MTAAAVILRHSRPRSPIARMREIAARDHCMNMVGRLTANAGGHGYRVDAAKRVIRYGAVALCHALGLRLTAAFLASLAGQITAEADSAGEP